MWREVEERTMGVGIGSIDVRSSRFSFGAATVRAWNLTRYHSATPLQNDSPGLVAFQMYVNGDGNRRLLRAGRGGETLAVSCQRVLSQAGAKPGRYKMHRDRDGFITVDFARGKPDQFAPRRNGGRR